MRCVRQLPQLWPVSASRAPLHHTSSHHPTLPPSICIASPHLEQCLPAPTWWSPAPPARDLLSKRNTGGESGRSFVGCSACKLMQSRAERWCIATRLTRRAGHQITLPSYASPVCSCPSLFCPPKSPFILLFSLPSSAI
jgi:hypothetical protein